MGSFLIGFSDAELIRRSFRMTQRMKITMVAVDFRVTEQKHLERVTDVMTATLPPGLRRLPRFAASKGTRPYMIDLIRSSASKISVRALCAPSPLDSSFSAALMSRSTCFSCP
jgi:hypothetical protein